MKVAYAKKYVYEKKTIRFSSFYYAKKNLLYHLYLIKIMIMVVSEGWRRIRGKVLKVCRGDVS